MVLKTVDNLDETVWIEVDMIIDKKNFIEVYKKGKKAPANIYFEDVKVININNCIIFDSRFIV